MTLDNDWDKKTRHNLWVGADDSLRNAPQCGERATSLAIITARKIAIPLYGVSAR